MYRLLFFLSAGLLSASIANSQGSNPFMNDANGRPLYLQTSYVADGSPYLYEEYALSEITLTNGKVYPNVQARVNLVDKEVTYKTDKGEEMVATSGIQKMVIHGFSTNGVEHPTAILQGFGAPLNNSGSHIYQVLTEGKVKLIKERVVHYTEQKKYSEANITRTFKTIETFYTIPAAGGTPLKLEKDRQAILAALPGKDQQLVSFMDREKIKLRREDDLVKLFLYYDTL